MLHGGNQRLRSDPGRPASDTGIPGFSQNGQHPPKILLTGRTVRILRAGLVRKGLDTFCHGLYKILFLLAKIVIHFIFPVPFNAVSCHKW